MALARPSRLRAHRATLQSRLRRTRWLVAKGAALRLDKYLAFARFAKTRARAQSLIVEGRVRIDGRPVTGTHADVKVGSVVTIMIGRLVRVLRVEALPHRRGPASEAQACYSEVSPPLTIDADGR